ARWPRRGAGRAGTRASARARIRVRRRGARARRRSRGRACSATGTCRLLRDRPSGAVPQQRLACDPDGFCVTGAEVVESARRARPPLRPTQGGQEMAAQDTVDTARKLYEHWNTREFDRVAELMA